MDYHTHFLLCSYFYAATVDGETIKIDMDDLREGENEIDLTVFGNHGGRISITLNVSLQTTSPPPGENFEIE